MNEKDRQKKVRELINRTDLSVAEKLRHYATLFPTEALSEYLTIKESAAEGMGLEIARIFDPADHVALDIAKIVEPLYDRAGNLVPNAFAKAHALPKNSQSDTDPAEGVAAPDFDDPKVRAAFIMDQLEAVKLMKLDIRDSRHALEITRKLVSILERMVAFEDHEAAQKGRTTSTKV